MIFISTCLEYCELDPCHFFSSLGLSWDAMLKITGIDNSDIDKCLFIENGILGCVSYIAKRHSKANNKHMQSYDVDKPSNVLCI